MSTLTTRSTTVVGAALLGLVALAGCSGSSHGFSPAGGASATGGQSATAGSGGSATGSGAGPTASAGGAASTGAAAAGSCTAQTTNVQSDSATQILHTVDAELPKACGFEVSGDLMSQNELPDGISINGNASYDASGDLHVPIVDQGVAIDIYEISGSEYVRVYEADSPTASPDVNVQGTWGGVLSNASIATVGSSNWVKLTSTQAAAFTKSGMGSNTSLMSAAKLADDIVASSGPAWALKGTATVNGVACVQVGAPSNGQDAPPTTLSVNAATGLPVQVSYTASDGTAILVNFSDYGQVPSITPPSAVVDGSTLS